MEKNSTEVVNNVYQKFSDYTVKVVSRQKTSVRRAFGAKATIIPEEGELWLVENKPRGPKSKEIGRGVHSRMVRRLDGNYTLTLRFSASEKLIREALLSEVRTMATLAAEDHKTMKGGNNGKA